MSTDPDLQRLYLDGNRASERLVERLENYGELVPARPAEAKSIPLVLARRVWDHAR